MRLAVSLARAERTSVNLPVGFTFDRFFTAEHCAVQLYAVTCRGEKEFGHERSHERRPKSAMHDPIPMQRNCRKSSRALDISSEPIR